MIFASRYIKILGPGLLESVYEAALVYELKKLRIPVEQQVGVPVEYDDVHLDIGFRADVIRENKFIVELKSVETLLDELVISQDLPQNAQKAQR